MSKAKLHQIIAVQADVTNQAHRDLTEIYHQIQKPELVAGLFKTYAPIKEDGAQWAPERKALQVKVAEKLTEVVKIMAKQFDITATRDVSNCQAKADLELPDGTVVKDLPSMFLLWLEKKMDELHAVVLKIPTLPADTEWKWDPEQNCYKNKHEIKTHRQDKEEVALVLLQPTQYHPGQAQKIVKDNLVGYWTTHLYSGALPVKEQKELKERVELLRERVKIAREKANQVEVTDVKVADGIMKYLFGAVAK